MKYAPTLRRTFSSGYNSLDALNTGKIGTDIYNKITAISVLVVHPCVETTTAEFTYIQFRKFVNIN